MKLRANDTVATQLESSPRRTLGSISFDQAFVPIVVIVMALYLCITNPFFFTVTNLTNLLLQGSILAIVAFGITFVIISGELDLSVGAGMALVSVVVALTARHFESIGIGILLGLSIGLLIGLINALVVTLLEVPSFIGTLGMLVIAQGCALALSQGAVVSGLPEGFSSLSNTRIFGLHLIVWLVALYFMVLLFIQKYTVFGLRVFAVGANRRASVVTGISTRRIISICFVISGFSMAFAGVALTTRVESGQPNAGSLLALTAVAAVVVGGTSILGGRGSIVRTLWGVLLITILENGLDLEGIDPDVKRIVIGVVFILAASTDFARRQFDRRKHK